VQEQIEIQPIGAFRPITIRPPGSKSITNRALVCAALADGVSLLHGALDSEDTQVMAAALDQLGIRQSHDRVRNTVEVQGCGGQIPASRAELFVANSGTTVRFLTALAVLGRGEFLLDGSPRMRERPIQDLLDGLNALGSDAQSTLNTGCPPVRVRAAGLPGGQASIRGDISSQFLSALLMAAPYAAKPVELTVVGELVSKPYIVATLQVMEAFGVEVEAEHLDRFTIPRAVYRAREYEIEPDASAASYFFGAAAITGSQITVSGLSRESLQGDVEFVDVLQRMGCHVDYGQTGISVRGGALHGIEVDMNAISDTVQTLAAVALFAQGPTTITGVAHIRHKETDRISALATELRKLGAQVEERQDGLTIVPGPLHGAELDTYQDHRMAMSLSLVGLRVPGVVINDPGCTGKTYPGFFGDLAKLSR
jgi:3-phosphoshikimate 1-carboxyvinyltransferase